MALHFYVLCGIQRGRCGSRESWTAALAPPPLGGVREWRSMKIVDLALGTRPQ